MPRYRAWLIVALLWLGAAEAAHAQCSISVRGGVGFGSYDVFSSSPTDSEGTIAYMCGGKNHDIRISLTSGGSPTYRPRRMTNGVDFLGYNLFSDAGRTAIWGDQTEGTGVYMIHNPANNTWIELTVFGRILPGQDVSVGAYRDAVIVEINF